MVDIAGVGLNATDTIIRLPISLPSIPKWNSQLGNPSGGQVASAMVALFPRGV